MMIMLQHDGTAFPLIFHPIDWYNSSYQAPFCLNLFHQFLYQIVLKCLRNCKEMGKCGTEEVKIKNISIPLLHFLRSNFTSFCHTHKWCENANVCLHHLMHHIFLKFIQSIWSWSNKDVSHFNMFSSEECALFW